MTAQIVIISDFNAESVGRYLNADVAAPGTEAQVAPYGQVYQLLTAPPENLKDATVLVWTRPEGVIAEYADALGGEEISQDNLLVAVDEFAAGIQRLAGAARMVLVASWVPTGTGRGLGMLEWTSQGTAQMLARMNLRLAEKLAEVRGVHMLDAGRWLAVAGAGARSTKHWLMMKCPFGEKVCQTAAQDVKAAIRASLGQTRKLVVVDLDNTMWGGIVGDDGWQNLRLGGHDYIGEAFVEFQKSLKALARRGIQIAIVSKNEESVALEAIDQHPEMVLKRGDICGWRINWNDKAQNIVELVKDLNLGLQSVIFLDDNPTERGRVREALPEVLVPDWPENPVNYADALRALDCFDQTTITAEDRARTRMYVEDRERKSSASTATSMAEWLAGLDVVIDVVPLDAASMKRTVQLINKTNQMNLTGHRTSEAELTAWLAAEPHRQAFSVSVGDRFGHLGLTGAFTLQRKGDALEVVDFVLSCRAMGRKVEDTLAHFWIEQARAAGAARVIAQAVPTAKNMPCLAFLRQADFTEAAANLFERDTTRPYGIVKGITLNTQAAQADDETAPC